MSIVFTFPSEFPDTSVTQTSTSIEMSQITTSRHVVVYVGTESTLVGCALSVAVSVSLWFCVLLASRYLLIMSSTSGAGGAGAGVEAAYREESDSIGVVRVPADKYFGAQSMRSMDNFRIGGLDCRMPSEVVQGAISVVCCMRWGSGGEGSPCVEVCSHGVAEEMHR